jgi:hypothetical protein
MQAQLTVGEIAFSLKEAGFSTAQSLDFGLHLDRLRTLIVQEDADAADLSAAVDASGISHVLVRNRYQQIAGVIVVGWLQEQVAAHLDTPVPSFKEAVNALHKAGIRGREWQNFNQPPLIWCRGGHWSNSDPCSEHQ